MTTLHTHAPRLLAGFGTAALVAAVGLFASSRPAHTAGGPIPVAVANTVQNSDIDNPARQPVAIRVLPTSKVAATFTVPAGKRLVIQQISAFAFSNTARAVTIDSTVSGGGAELRVPFRVNNGAVDYATEAITDYADAGTTVNVGVDDSSDTLITEFTVDIRGYYVNVS